MERALSIHREIEAHGRDLENNDYVAMCKWVEAGIDGIRQWDFESNHVIKDILSGLEWEHVSNFRNTLSHSFADSSVAVVTEALDEWIPELVALILNLNFCPIPRTTQGGFRIPTLKTASMQRLGISPLDAERRKDEIEAGAKIHHRCARLYIHYDELYYQHIFYKGYDHFGRHWMVAPSWGHLPRTVDIWTPSPDEPATGAYSEERYWEGSHFQ